MFFTLGFPLRRGKGCKPFIRVFLQYSFTSFTSHIQTITMSCLFYFLSLSTIMSKMSSCKVPFASLLCLDIHTAAKVIFNSVLKCVLTNSQILVTCGSLNWNRITLNSIKYKYLFLSYTCRISRAKQPLVASCYHIGWLKAYFYITKRSMKFSCVLDHITLLYFFKWLPISYR